MPPRGPGCLQFVTGSSAAEPLGRGCRPSVQGGRSWSSVAASPAGGALACSRSPIGSASASALVPSRFSHPALGASMAFGLLGSRLRRRFQLEAHLRRRNVIAWVPFDPFLSVSDPHGHLRVPARGLTNRSSCQAARRVSERDLARRVRLAPAPPSLSSRIIHGVAGRRRRRPAAELHPLGCATKLGEVI